MQDVKLWLRIVTNGDEHRGLSGEMLLRYQVTSNHNQGRIKIARNHERKRCHVHYITLVRHSALGGEHAPRVSHRVRQTFSASGNLCTLTVGWRLDPNGSDLPPNPRSGFFRK